MTLRKVLSIAVAIGAIGISRTPLAQDAAPEKPGVQELRLKDGRKVAILWNRFKVHKFHLYMKGDAAFINNELLANQSRDVRRIIQWAAEEQGIRGDVEQHLRDSIKRPVALRFIAAKPLVLEIPYATGVNVDTGRDMVLPLCAVDPKDQRLTWEAADKMKVFRDYEDREDDRVFAARRAAQAAERAAWAAENAERNTRDILDSLQY
jgi:hypothetical protein